MIPEEKSAIIVEDLPAARENLVEILASNLPEIRVIGHAESVIEAAKLLAKGHPDILFLDIELGADTAFDLLDMVPALKSKIIFTTASEDYALRAFRYAALDYLLKPIDPEELISAVARGGLRDPKIQESQLDIVRQNKREGGNRQVDRIALHTMENIFIVELEDVIRCEADGNYSKFFIKDQKPILVTKTLKEYDKLLSENGFLRVHQSHLVNSKYISSFVKIDGGYLLLKEGTKVPVSSRKKATVVQALDQLS